MTTIAFLGTGTMGGPMARNLLTSGFTLRAWNRTSEKARPLAAAGAHVAATPAEAARDADVLITMLLDGEATAHAGQQACTALATDAVWLQMGTIGLAGIAEVHRVAGAIPVVDAPVLGSQKPAEQGTLVALAAGRPGPVREQVTPVLEAMTERTLWVGTDSAEAAGTRVKLVVNNWVLALNNAVGESVSLAQQLGVNARHFLDAISGTATDSQYAQAKGGAILDHDFSTAFALSAAGKDADLIAHAAGTLRLDLAEAGRARLHRAIVAGHGDSDMAAAYFASYE